MATTHESSQPIDTSTLDGAVEEYPSDWRYVKVAIVLAVITAVEVHTYIAPDLWEPILVPALLGMMALKFFGVAWYFMHLKYDKKVLTWSFYSGAVLALLVYLAVLFVFNFFG